jgi:hypothetical protein
MLICGDLQLHSELTPAIVSLNFKYYDCAISNACFRGSKRPFHLVIACSLYFRKLSIYKDRNGL